MVAIGAITAAPAKALPSELEEFMQSAGDHGVVYASLGTTAIPGQLCDAAVYCDMILLYYVISVLACATCNVKQLPTCT